MSQYSDRVERQKLLLEAEKWAKEIKSLHAHSMDSMWYDTRPQDTEDGKFVTDIQYYSGLVKREFADGDYVYLGEELKGKELINEYVRNN